MEGRREENQKCHLDDGALADTRAQADDGVGDGALLQVGAVADDGVVDFALHHLGRRQEARRRVDGRLRVVELEPWRLQRTSGFLEFLLRRIWFPGIASGCN